jgi:Flp pilus assembly protein TadD
VFALAFLAAPFDLTARSKSERETEALRHYRFGQMQFEQGKTMPAIESLRKAVSLNPNLAEAHYYLGYVHLQQSQHKEALRGLKKAVRINPYYTDAHNLLGVAYRELKDYDRALEAFETALNDRSYKSQEKIHLNIGHLYLARGIFAEAIRSFEKAVAINPKYLRGFLGLGAAYQRWGRGDLAEQELRKVVALGPGSPEAAEARQLLAQQAKRDPS